MEIEKTNRMNALFEFYAALLTDKQMNYIELYYADDYSLAEIQITSSVAKFLMISWKNTQTIAIFRNKLLCSAALIIEIRFKQKVREEMIYGF